jgi:SAM-dependent methyltransferase
VPYYKSSHFSIWNYIPIVTLQREKHLKDFLKRFASSSIIVDIGSGGRFISPGVITFDKFVMEQTQVVGDIHDLPFKGESIDCIICTGTLEHIENPWKAAQEFYRVLKKGGHCYVAAPFMQGYHPDPTDLWRFTLEGFEILFKDFDIIEKGVLQGTGSGLSWALVDFFRAFSDNHYISALLGVIARFSFFWVKYFDYVFAGKINDQLFPSGYYIVGRK